jgi:hypothetical protein
MLGWQRDCHFVSGVPWGFYLLQAFPAAGATLAIPSQNSDSLPG